MSSLESSYPGIQVRDLFLHIKSFRYHWHWRTNAPGCKAVRRPLSFSLGKQAARQKKDQNDFDDASAWATNMLSGRALELEIDFPSGRAEVKPKTLLDWLVWSLIECRRRLAICANRGCMAPYFVKPHPRAKYCSVACSEIGRQIGQRRWEESHRTKVARKRGAGVEA